MNMSESAERTEYTQGQARANCQTGDICTSVLSASASESRAERARADSRADSRARSEARSKADLKRVPSEVGECKSPNKSLRGTVSRKLRARLPDASLRLHVDVSPISLCLPATSLHIGRNCQGNHHPIAPKRPSPPEPADPRARRQSSSAPRISTRGARGARTRSSYIIAPPFPFVLRPIPPWPSLTGRALTFQRRRRIPESSGQNQS
jgi:hypothetical protein